MQKLNDLSRCLTTLEPGSTVIAVIEMSESSWLVAGIVPGVERQPLKKLAVRRNERGGKSEIGERVGTRRDWSRLVFRR
jgi:hypothetical protein